MNGDEVEIVGGGGDGDEVRGVTPESARSLTERIKEITREHMGGEEYTSRDAAYTFLESCGLDPTPDSVGQLTEAFLPALRIMCERGYDPNGETWRDAGWRGLLHEIRKKQTRLHHRSWLRALFDWDSAVDMLNYLGFYIRLRNQGPSWGNLGEPGSLADEPNTEVLMGDYKTARPS